MFRLVSEMLFILFFTKRINFSCSKKREKIPYNFFLFSFAGSLHLPDIWSVQHWGKSAVHLKADWVSERNDMMFLIGPPPLQRKVRGVADWKRDSFFLFFHMSVPLPFMLGLTYMHPVPPLNTDTRSKEPVIPQPHWPIFHCLFKFLNSWSSI